LVCQWLTFHVGGWDSIQNTLPQEYFSLTNLKMAGFCQLGYYHPAHLVYWDDTYTKGYLPAGM
jgi:hypothetical protein